MERTEPTATLIQKSFRMPAETQEFISQSAAKHNVTQCEFIRKAVSLYKIAEDLPANLKLAVVDIDDHSDPEHYRVSKWIID